VGGTGWWLPCCCSTFLNLTVYGLVIPLSALVIAVTVPGMVPGSPGRADRRDLTVRGVGGAALLYGLYHVGYGMGGADIVFLVGLGVVYAVVFALARNVIAIWPLLTPSDRCSTTCRPATSTSRGPRSQASPISLPPWPW